MKFIEVLLVFALAWSGSCSCQLRKSGARPRNQGIKSSSTRDSSQGSSSQSLVSHTRKRDRRTGAEGSARRWQSTYFPGIVETRTHGEAEMGELTNEEDSTTARWRNAEVSHTFRSRLTDRAGTTAERGSLIAEFSMPLVQFKSPDEGLKLALEEEHLLDVSSDSSSGKGDSGRKLQEEALLSSNRDSTGRNGALQSAISPQTVQALAVTQELAPFQPVWRRRANSLSRILHSLSLSPMNSSGTLVLPLKYVASRSPGTTRQPRNLGETSSTTLRGSLLRLGYYYTDMWFGVPGQQFSLLVDTGSALTFVPGSSCRSRCGKHLHPPFDPESSVTHNFIPCPSPACLSRRCNSLGQCQYQRQFAENSSTLGLLVSDVASFRPLQSEASSAPENEPLVQGVPRVIFGVAEAESGQLSAQKADGVLGLGRGRRSVVEQLAQRRGMSRQFSLCYAGTREGDEEEEGDEEGEGRVGAHGGGVLVLGNLTPALGATGGMAYTPFDKNRRKSNYFQVAALAICIAGVRIPVDESVFDHGYGAVVDSGTTFTYLPRPAFAEFRASVLSHLQGLERVLETDSQSNGLCFREKAPSNWDSLGAYFPSVEFVFGGNMTYLLDVENYVFKHHVHGDVRCIGVYPNPDADAGLILGALLWKNTLVQFDMVTERLGLLKTDCSQFGAGHLDSHSQSPHSHESAGELDQQQQEFGEKVLPKQQQRQQGQEQSFSRVWASRAGSVAAALTLAGGEISGDPSTTKGGQPSGPDAEDSLVQSFRTVDATGCQGCAAYIDITLRFYPGSSAAAATPVWGQLPAVVQQSLFLLPNQVQLVSVNQSPANALATDVSLRVVPFGTQRFLSGAIAQRVQTGIYNLTLPRTLLNATGPFNVTAVNATAPIFGEPISAPPAPAHGDWRPWVFTSLVVLVAALAIVWICKIRREQKASQSKNFVSLASQAKRDAEEESVMAGGNAGIVTKSSGPASITTVCHSPKRALTVQQV